ncbi:helix-turn-helix domain-containing protein [Microvirga sp. 2TAF3]|uniref:helix-turn-helix domain-containing protein n=1 Tax=Microvirga sp. 2TAF3 TaxID=3233014 RepID=UPI003F9C1840
MDKPKNRRLATPKEAAERLKVSVSFLAKARMKGTGPRFLRLGRAIRYAEEALDEYEAVNTRKSTSEY